MLIAHLSDPHLRPLGALHQGLVDTNALFVAALRHLDAIRPRPDLVLLTGDLVDEGTAAEYALAREMLATLGAPLLAIPGNHDEREAFRRCFDGHAHLPPTGPLHFTVGEHGPVRVVALDVTVPGQHHGEATDEAVAWLERTLADEPARPTILMMHQPPVVCGVPYLDTYRCRGGERLAAVLDRFGSVERVLCGHVHRLMQVRFGGTLLCTAPSTGSAIALRLDPGAEPASYLEPPAFLLHQWRAGIGLVTHLVPVGSFPGPLPFA